MLFFNVYTTLPGTPELIGVGIYYFDLTLTLYYTYAPFLKVLRLAEKKKIASSSWNRRHIVAAAAAAAFKITKQPHL